MKILNRTFIFLFFIVFVITNAAAQKRNQRLFVIENSLIKSKVVYSIRLNYKYEISGKKPVYNFWLRPSGSTRAVKWFERRGYGIASQKVLGPSVMKMTLTPYSKLEITIKINGRKAVPYVNIRNKNVILTKIYVIAKKGFFGHETQKVLLYAKDPVSNKVITQEIK